MQSGNPSEASNERKWGIEASCFLNTHPMFSLLFFKDYLVESRNHPENTKWLVLRIVRVFFIVSIVAL